MTHEAISDRGVRCPICAHVSDPEEAFYYDDDRHDEECGMCGANFTWTYHRRDSWHSKLVEKSNE